MFKEGEQMSDLKELIKKNEGLRLKPYRCSAGKLTIGYGRNLDDVGIDKTEAELMLEHDIEDAEFSLGTLIYAGTNERISANRYNALVDMIFNLGLTRFKGFKKMIEAIKKGDWETASKEALNSKWAEQVGVRAERDALMLKMG